MPSGFQPAVLSAALAAATVAIATRLPDLAAREFLAVLLEITAGVYLGFAVLDGRRVVFTVELAGIALFLIFAILGLRMSPLFLAGGFLLHGVWDALQHPRIFEIRMADWHRLACIVYDAIVAAYIYFRWRSTAAPARLPG